MERVKIFNFKLRKGILLLVIAMILGGAGWFAMGGAEVKINIMPDFWVVPETRKMADSYLKKQVGEDYVGKFKYLRTYRRPGSRLPPIFSNEAIIVEYEFLPFTVEHQYIVTVRRDLTEGTMDASEIPICTQKQGQERCNFKFNYSQAYELGKQKLATLSGVRLEEDENGYKWYVYRIDGDPLCVPTTNWFYVDTSTGVATEITSSKGNFCV